MQYRPYPRYQASGVEWIGDVPEGWEVQSIKHFARFVYGDALPSEIREINGDVPVFGSNGPVGFHNKSNTLAPTLFVGRKGSYGALKWSEVPSFAIDTVYFIDASSCAANLRWLYWNLHSANLDSVSQDTGVPGLSREIAHNTKLPLPPLTDQLIIATFLDSEIAKIDALIAKQQAMVVLLREKRQAIISHAVTKGLNPNAPMKASGNQWIGSVPEHWDVQRLHTIALILSGYPFASSDFTENGVPLIRMSNFVEGKLLLEDVKYIQKALVPLHAYGVEGDILTGLSGSVTNYAMITAHDLPVAINQRVGIIRVSARANRNYVCYLMRSSVFLQQMTAYLPQTTIQNISLKQVSMCKLPFPSLIEQSEIALFLDAETAKIDALIAKHEQMIVFMQEHRAALITAAVTGKIDLRQQGTDEAASSVQSEEHHGDQQPAPHFPH